MLLFEGIVLCTFYFGTCGCDQHGLLGTAVLFYFKSN